jgi:hypothetical protein
VVDSRECSDEPLGSGTTELVGKLLHNCYCLLTVLEGHE